ncbi:MAG: hypothetical protein IJP54_05235 [Synergistaceae bacterium]|nr:hypothetical protein [Synergistaceae bacterium]
MIEETTRELIRLFREQVEENTVLSAGSIVEIAKLPVIVLNGPTLTEKKRLMRDPERITVIDEEAGEAVREIPPRWYDLHFDVNISCESNLVLVSLVEKLSRLNQRYSLLTAKNEQRERQYLWRWETPPQVSTTPNISQVAQGRAGIIVYDVEVYSEIREVWPLIERVSVEINKDRIEVQE